MSTLVRSVSLREFQGEEASDIFAEEKEEEQKKQKEEEQKRAAAVPGMCKSPYFSLALLSLIV